ncbi:MAG: FG-GAP-like repeat-containing protein [Ferruginibacter sp.]
MRKIVLYAVLCLSPLMGDRFLPVNQPAGKISLSWLRHIKPTTAINDLISGHHPAPATPDTTSLKQSNWYKEALENIERSEYNISYQEDTKSYTSPNRSQDLRCQYNSTLFTLQPRTGGNDKWKLELSTTGIFAKQQLLYAPTSEPIITQNGASIRFNHADNFITEYINSKEGVRQNFIIHKEPASKPRQLSIRLKANKGWYVNKVAPGEIHFAKAKGDGFEKKITYKDLNVWDADNKKLEAAFEVKGNEIAINVNTTNAAYPITVDPLSTTADWTAESNQASAYFGYSVSSAGDVNGDGYSDVIIGAYNYSVGGGSGAAFVYHGSATGLSSTVNWTTSTTQPSFYGTSVATAGDVNGDGYSDVIVGAYLYANGQTGEGGAFVYHGSASGLSTTPAWQAESNQINAQFGISVASAGDVNGDGYSDVIVGANGYSNGQTGEGAAFVYQGSASGLSTTANWSAESNQAAALFGRSVASAGDVNGDGYSDVIIGAYQYTNGQASEGAAFVYHGSASGLSATANWTAESNQASANLGIAVASAGDVNGDGYSDVIVGAYLYDNGTVNEGAAFVYQGSASGLSASASWTGDSNQNASFYGRSVASAGDVNGDGYSDVIVGAYTYSNGQANEGRAFLYMGSATGLSAATAWTAESNQAGASFGISVASAGDVNGDGYSDVIVGAHTFDNGQTDEGSTFTYHGAANGISSTFTTQIESNQAGAEMGFSVSCAGDVNGDGYSDVIIGAPYYDNGQSFEGRAYVYHGRPAGLLTTADWTAEINLANTYFGSAVSGAGDVNGDGYSDVIIGAPGYSNGQSSEGAAFVYHGSAAGLSATANWTSESNQANALFGNAVASAGDVNGDGYSDVIIGAGNATYGESAEGAAFVYKGSATGLSVTPLWSGESNQANAQYGTSVAGAGDVNGDGYGDIIIGSRNYQNGQVNEGKVFVYYGAAAGPSVSISWSFECNQAAATLGESVASAGDVNGDGYSDVIVGANNYSNGELLEGRAFVFHGSAAGLSATPNWTGESNQGSAGFGAAVSSAGDVNGDGYSDVLIGCPYYTNGQTNEGMCFVYYGSASGLSASAGWMAESNQAGALFGNSVSSAGDVNADGYSDVLVGSRIFSNAESSEGAAFLYTGNAGNGLRNNLRLYNTDLVTPIQKSNINNPNLFGAGLFSKSFLGRTKAKLAWEVKQQGQPFSGNPLSNSVAYYDKQTFYTDLGISGTELKNNAQKRGKQTKIRARVEYSKATAITGQVYGPWRYPPGYTMGAYGMSATPLPLTLISFTGSFVNDNETNIQWITSNELNLATYVVERSYDGIQFAALAPIPATGINGSSTRYNYSDKTVAGNIVYYRLRIIEKDGTASYTRTITLTRGNVVKLSLAMNPLPAGQDAILIAGGKPDALKGTVLITDMTGRRIGVQHWTLPANGQRISITTRQLPAGLYNLLVQSENSSQTLRLVVH